MKIKIINYKNFCLFLHWVMKWSIQRPVDFLNSPIYTGGRWIHLDKLGQRKENVYDNLSVCKCRQADRSSVKTKYLPSYFVFMVEQTICIGWLFTQICCYFANVLADKKKKTACCSTGNTLNLLAV